MRHAIFVSGALLLAAGIGCMGARADRPDQIVLPDPFRSVPSLAPTLMSVDIQQASAADALAAINAAAHTQYKLAAPKATDPAPPPSTGPVPPITLQARQRPLLEVLLQYRSLARLGMPTPRAADQQSLDANAFGSDLGSWCVSGPFAFVVNGIGVSTTLAPDGTVRSTDLSMTIYPVFEPKLRIITYPNGLKLVEVVDDMGNSLIPGEKDAPDFFPPTLSHQSSEGTSRSSDLYAYLRMPRRAGKRIATFKATAVYTVQLQSEVVDTKELQTPLTRTVGKFTYTVGPFTQDTRMSLPLVVKRGEASDEDWANVTRVLKSLTPSLNNDAARPIQGRNPALSEQAGQVTITFDFPAGPPRSGPPTITDYRIELPGDLQRAEVPVEFHDLPLP